MKLNGIEKNTETKKKSVMAILKRVSVLAVSVLIIGCILWGVPAITLIGAEEEQSATGANDAGSDGGFMLPLVRPVFAQAEPMVEPTTFLEREAGISAFTDVGRRIDLTRVRGEFRTIERETANYTLGSVGIPGRTEWWDVHVLVHRDGWILAYYHRDRLTSTMINWADIGTTNMEIALQRVATAAGVPVATVSYYHFRFPDAQNMVVIADDDDFRINIPRGFMVHDRTFILRDRGLWTYHRIYGWVSGYSRLTINTVEIARATNGTEIIGTIIPLTLPLDTLHTIDVTPQSGRVADGEVSLVLIYSKN